MSRTKNHGGTAWREVLGGPARIRKTDNGWFQVQAEQGAAVQFSDRDSDRAWYRAVAISLVTNSADSKAGGQE